MGPLAMMAIGTGVSALNKVLGFGGGKMYDPRKHKDELVMSPGDMAQLRGQGQRRIQESMAAPMASFRSWAAANKMPAGMVTSGLHGFASKAGRATADLDVSLEKERHNQLLNYHNMLMGSQNAQAQFQHGQFDFTPEIGSLTRAMMLYQSGMLTPEQGQQAELPK